MSRRRTSGGGLRGTSGARLTRCWWQVQRGLFRLGRHRLVLLVLAAVLAVPVAVAWHRSELVAPEPTLLLRDQDGLFVAEIGAGPDEPYGYWPVEPAPERVVAATLALEDRRFHDHWGVDPVAVARAVGQNLSAGERVSGASTLAMQVARMQHPAERTWANKILESMTAMLMTARYGREAVLAHYLRLVPYGNRIRGIGYAARRYLDKPVADLSWAEIAFLAAIPQSPTRMNPFDPQGRLRAIRRADRVLEELFAAGVLSDDELALARSELAHIRVPDRGQRPEIALHTVLQLEDDLGQPEVRHQLRDQPIVTISLDLALQEQVVGHVQEAMRQWQPRGAGQAAVVLVDRHSWEVRASVGSAGYDSKAGAIDFTRVRRYPGSTLKPFVYAQALEQGAITPGTILDDLPRAPDAIGNADKSYMGPVLPRKALANSRNVPAVRLVEQLGLDPVYGLFRDLGLHRDELPAEHYGLGVAIGGMPTSLQQLLGAYTAIASGDGRLHDLVWYERQARAPGPSLYSPTTAQLVGHMLSDSMARMPSFPRMGHAEYPFAVAVKTGTSPQYRDSWTVAWSEDWLVGVWVGDPDYRAMQQLSGYRAAADLAHTLLVDLHRDRLDGLSDHGFPAPEGTRAVEICPLTGLLASEACTDVVTEWFTPDTEPQQHCTAHHRDGERMLVDLPGRYMSWEAREGLAHSMPALAGLPTLRITSPGDGTAHIRDPDVPADRSTLALSVAVDPPVEQVVWYVDGQPIALAEPPYDVRWPIQDGEHTITAGLPNTGVVAPPVTIRGL